MKIFLCPSCHQVIYFESVRCMCCGAQLGFVPAHQTMAALERTADDPVTRETVFHARDSIGDTALGDARMCANFVEHATCNWTVPADDPDPFCQSCRLDDVIPSLATPDAVAGWSRVEAAKRRLLYTMLALDLPLTSRRNDPQSGLAFVFKQDLPGSEKVTTGHADGVITINLAEADDAHREKTRAHLGEKYRSLLGHFRHESGHYYWERLIRETPWQEEFRTLFGDERADYAAALARHYQQGPVANWHETHVSPYAAAHPWEDWAESWAHYLHMVDTLETSRSYGISLRPQPVGGPPAEKLTLRSISLQTFDAMIHAWVPLTLALNDFNRGMGLPDLYPFALPNPAIEKISFVHRLIHDRAAAIGTEGVAASLPARDSAVAAVPG